MPTHAVVLFALLLCAVCAAHAQTPTPAPAVQTTTERTPATSSPQRQQSGDAPPASQQTPRDATTPASHSEDDISIEATVTARELRFDVVPNPSVEFPGRPRRETVWEADRQNLPRPVRPGETYRDIGIRLRITSRFADIERIVAEALGEVPIRDDDNDDNDNDDDDNAPPRPPQSSPATGQQPGVPASPSTSQPRQQPTSRTQQQPPSQRQPARQPAPPDAPAPFFSTSLPPPPASPAPRPAARGRVRRTETPR